MAAKFQCISCGRDDWEFPLTLDRRAEVTEGRVRELGCRFEELVSGKLTIKRLRERMPQMCGSCQTLMIGISGEDDRLELQERIREHVQFIRGDIREDLAA